MPQNWKTYKLLEIVDQKRGISYGIVQPGKHYPEGIPILKVNNLTSSSINIAELHFVSPLVDKKYLRTRLKGGELLLSLVGTLGEVFQVPKEMTGMNVVRALAVIPVLEKFSPKWVEYWLKSPTTRNKLEQIATTSVQATINLKELREIEIPFPIKKEREAIASILSTIDAKIENNLAINKTLEEMAMALYKEWFVDFGPFQDGKFVDSELGMIPEGWEVKRLDEIALVKGGKRLPKGNQLQKEPNIHPYIRVKDFDKAFVLESNLEYVPDDIFNSISRYIVNTDDVILSIVGTVGSVALIGANLDNASLTENCAKISLIDNNISSEVLYMYLTSIEGQDDIKNKTVGSTQPKLPIYNIKNIQFAFPNMKNRVKVPVIQIEHNMKTIYSNLIQNQSLTTLRDTLLPKLTSGEVRLNEFANT